MDDYFLIEVQPGQADRARDAIISAGGRGWMDVAEPWRMVATCDPTRTELGHGWTAQRLEACEVPDMVEDGNSIAFGF
jgi:hypothetical protein